MADPGVGHQKRSSERIRVCIGIAIVLTGAISLWWSPLPGRVLAPLLGFAVVVGLLWSTGAFLPAAVAMMAILIFIDPLTQALQSRSPSVRIPWWEPIVIVYAVVVAVFYAGTVMRRYASRMGD